MDDFFSKCERMNWTYSCSEDPAVWRRGDAAMRELQAEASESVQKREIFNAWKAYGWRTGPKPVRGMRMTARVIHRIVDQDGQVKDGFVVEVSDETGIVAMLEYDQSWDEFDAITDAVSQC